MFDEIAQVAGRLQEKFGENVLNVAEYHQLTGSEMKTTQSIDDDDTEKVRQAISKEVVRMIGEFEVLLRE